MTLGKKLILDVTCGARSIWFQKNESHTIYCDRRKEEYDACFGKDLKHRHLSIDPDVICDFTELPFPDNTFKLVVFDPPHVANFNENAWLTKRYGTLKDGWQEMLRKGFKECMRVLSIGGVLIFKWSDVSISTREVINVLGQNPLFGHRSGKKMNTHWLCFMKFDD